MSVAEQLREEGRKTAAEQFARESLIKGIDAKTVAEICHLDIAIVNKIKETLH